MNVKASVTLEEDVVSEIARASREGESRSETIERLLRWSLAEHARRAADERDRRLIDAHAAELNAEADDVLAYQAETKPCSALSASSDPDLHSSR